MKPTPIQRRNLALYLKFKGSFGSVAQLFFFNRFRYIPMFLGMILSLFFLHVPELNRAGTVMMGALAGALLRDVGYFVRTARIWPLLQHIIDWEKAKKIQE
jgi:hypothetical protein